MYLAKIADNPRKSKEVQVYYTLPLLIAARIPSHVAPAFVHESLCLFSRHLKAFQCKRVHIYIYTYIHLFIYIPGTELTPVVLEG